MRLNGKEYSDQNPAESIRLLREGGWLRTNTSREQSAENCSRRYRVSTVISIRAARGFARLVEASFARKARTEVVPRFDSSSSAAFAAEDFYMSIFIKERDS